MPELPDLVHIVAVLKPAISGKIVQRAIVREPVVLRIALPGTFSELLAGARFADLERHGPFLRFSLEPSGADAGYSGPLDLVMHLMLAGRLKLVRPDGAAASAKALPATAFSLELTDGSILHYGDEKNMGKVYLCDRGRFDIIPGYATQGIDVTTADFSFQAFSALIDRKRCQARVFIMDQTMLSAIGNAYADEILFEAMIHPKATCSTLTAEERRRLYDAVVAVITWGIDRVEQAGRPLEDKVRDHLKVRGRAGQACPRCGTTIRKVGVLGFDAYFCPRCQPDKAGKGFVDWTKLPSGGAPKIG